MSTTSGSSPRRKTPPKLATSCAAIDTTSSVEEELGGKVLCRWSPKTEGPELLVMQGDLTCCKADAIVNAANTRLMHGGGLAGAIVRSGGSSIQQESSKWVKDHGPLTVGDAVTTAAGKLTCQHVIHTVGPNVGSETLTSEHATQLRHAVWSALLEADRLEVKSVAVPGISTGIFGYPRDLGAKEIVTEAAEFCKEKAGSTALKRIALMNIDDPTVKSFVEAATDEMEESGKRHKDLSEALAGLKVRE
ncbi:Macro domain [Phytophthora infestans]|uniref:Macro domain n=1 Tax=Phytophthora infestans TaxID=4787 RepID=A0A833TIY6_PHYIN|nr:Macro domain [Phytophthora infestans]KAF4133669.1 Macro domain [Phytophthora infestans]